MSASMRRSVDSASGPETRPPPDGRFSSRRLRPCVAEQRAEDVQLAAGAEPLERLVPIAAVVARGVVDLLVVVLVPPAARRRGVVPGLAAPEYGEPRDPVAHRIAMPAARPHQLVAAPLERRPARRAHEIRLDRRQRVRRGRDLLACAARLQVHACSSTQGFPTPGGSRGREGGCHRKAEATMKPRHVAQRGKPLFEVQPRSTAALRAPEPIARRPAGVP